MKLAGCRLSPCEYETKISEDLNRDNAASADNWFVLKTGSGSVLVHYTGSSALSRSANDWGVKIKAALR